MPHDRPPRTLRPSLELLRQEYVLVQAWKKTAAYIRRHNWFSDTLELDLKAVDLKGFLDEIKEHIESPNAWKSKPLRIVPAPKSQDWWVRNRDSLGDPSLPDWQPRPPERCQKTEDATKEHTKTDTLDDVPKSCKEARDVATDLRPLAHVALRDQVAASALMLCLANRVETRQGDPRPPTGRGGQRAQAEPPRFMSYGNRLFCDDVDGELRHRWGATRLYRSYYQDYREFLAQPRRAAEKAARDTTVKRTFIVRVDLSRFYDRVRPKALHGAIGNLLKDTECEDFLSLASRVLHWNWCKKDKEQMELYGRAAGVEEFDQVALPQGLVSAGFWANLMLLSFDAEIRKTYRFNGLNLVYACRYVDDLRLVVTLPARKRGDASERPSDEENEAIVGKWVQDLVQNLLCARAPGLVLNEDKTVAEEFTADRANTVLQSQRMNRIQARVSGGFTASEGLELLESIQGLLMLRSSFSREADRSRWEHAPEPEVPEDTRARFGAFRYRKIVRDIRSLLPDHDNFGANGAAAGTTTGVLTRTELDEMTRAFALVLIEKWVNDPSNVRILLIAFDLWPEADLLQSVLGLLRPWIQNKRPQAREDQKNCAAWRVASYCLSEIFRAGATETGFSGDAESRPESLCLSEYRRVLMGEAWEVLTRADPAAVPWYLRQQALLLLFGSGSYSSRLADKSLPEDPPHYRQMARLLAGDTDRFEPAPRVEGTERSPSGPAGGNAGEVDSTCFASYATVLHRCFQRSIPGAKWTAERTKAVANLDPAFAVELVQNRDGPFEGEWATLAEQLLVDRGRFDPNSLARLVMDRAEQDTDPRRAADSNEDRSKRDDRVHRDELSLLRLVSLLINALHHEPSKEAIPPWQVTLNRAEGTIKERQGEWPWGSACITCAGPEDRLEVWEPPAHCEQDDRWRYQLGYLLRFALARNPDFTVNLKRRRPEAPYRSAVSSWLQRKYGNYNGQSAFGGDWLPMSDWLERFLSGLLWWPGRTRDRHTRVIDRGLASTKDLVAKRLRRLERHTGKATKVQFLPMSFSSSYLSKELKSLSGCVVQTTYPAPKDLEDDLTLSSAPARARHRDHLMQALALVRQSLELQNADARAGRHARYARPTENPSRDSLKSEPRTRHPRLDLLVLPELAVHPDDINRCLKPFAQKFKTVILAGVVYEKLPPETTEFVNTAVWVIPEYNQTNGWNIRVRRQGKEHLARGEDRRQYAGSRVGGHRPFQWIIECPASGTPPEPLRLTASVCYDATDLGIVADLRERSDVYIIPAFNKDVQTFDSLAIALSFQMYQLVVVANHGKYGGSSAYWPIGKPHERRVMHIHGENQTTLGFFEIPDVVEYRRSRVEELAPRHDWKTPPAGFRKKQLR